MIKYMHMTRLQSWRPYAIWERPPNNINPYLPINAHHDAILKHICAKSERQARRDPAAGWSRANHIKLTANTSNTNNTGAPRHTNELIPVSICCSRPNQAHNYPRSTPGFVDPICYISVVLVNDVGGQCREITNNSTLMLIHN